MNEAARADVRDAARYLRRVRPVDPEEVAEYVEGRPHPAAVRQVLREEAVDLGLVEREDGTFVPPGDEPVAPLAGPVTRLPARYDRALGDLLVERYGADWASGASGDELRGVVRRLKEAYYRGRDVEYGPSAALGYAVYHLADFYAATQYVLSDLASGERLGRSVSVLDVGAGVGGPALGLFDLLGDDALVDYRAVEPSPAADVAARLFEEAPRNVHARVERTTAEAFEPDGPYDLVLFANVLGELDDPVAVAERYAEAVADDGSLVLLAPADKETATGLREVERALVDGPTGVSEGSGAAEESGAAEGSAADEGPGGVGLSVFSPTARLWPGERPTDRCWSFDVRPDLAVPRTQRSLDSAGGGTGEFVNVDVQFAYAVLRRDGARLLDIAPDPDRFAKLADSEDHVTERVDVVAVKLSHDLADGGNPLFLVGDGSQRVDHFAVLARETGANAALRAAEYGDGLVVERALVLWNDDEGAYNLVVDGETLVDAVPARPSDPTRS